MDGTQEGNGTEKTARRWARGTSLFLIERGAAFLREQTTKQQAGRDREREKGINTGVNEWRSKRRKDGETEIAQKRNSTVDFKMDKRDSVSVFLLKLMLVLFVFRVNIVSHDGIHVPLETKTASYVVSARFKMRHEFVR
mmetsp:Transcript_18603/g.37644  ORF Transcript_18603/g.37644 Transcript_18603/m.37644 type:complete len:139 (+) Transcript_18603:236-652(+)